MERYDSGQKAVVRGESRRDFLAENKAFYDRGYLKSRMVWLDSDGDLNIRVHGQDDYYWIANDRLNTGAKRWEWVQHLSEKRWFTPEMLCDMVVILGRPARRCDP